MDGEWSTLFSPRGIGSYKAMRGGLNSTFFHPFFWWRFFFLGMMSVINRKWGEGVYVYKNNYNYNNVFGYQTKNWRWDECLSVFLGKQNGKMRGLMRGLKTQLPDPKKTPWHPWWKQGRITVVPKMPGQIQGYGWVWVPQSEVWGRYAKLLIARVDIHPVLLDLCNT